MLLYLRNLSRCLVFLSPPLLLSHLLQDLLQGTLVFHWDDLVPQDRKLPLVGKSLEHLLSMVPVQKCICHLAYKHSAHKVIQYKTEPPNLKMQNLVTHLTSGAASTDILLTAIRKRSEKTFPAVKI